MVVDPEILVRSSGVLILADPLMTPQSFAPGGIGETLAPAKSLDDDGAFGLPIDLLVWKVATSRGEVGPSLFVCGWTKASSIKAAIAGARPTKPPPGIFDHFAGWHMQMMMRWMPGMTYEELTTQVDAPDMEMLSTTYSAIALMNHKISRVENCKAPRSLARRGHREGVVPAVRYVTLRREEIGSEKDLESVSSKGSINWTHRHMVSGHWKRQWYGGIGEHRRIYIAPYIRGPQDKPLIIKDTVYGWVK